MTMNMASPKKLMTVLMAAVIAFLGIFATTGTEAGATTTGCTFKNGHGIELMTDANSYSTSATTVDAKAVRCDGTARTVYYDMNLEYYRTDGIWFTQWMIRDGYFSSATPWKSFNIDSAFPNAGTFTARVSMDVYSDSAHNNFIGTWYTPSFKIYQN